MLRRVLLILVMLAAACAVAHAQTPAMPKLSIGLDTAKGPQDVSASLQIVFILTILSLAPSLLMMVTSFTRIVIVLSFTRSAIGTQQVPPNSVLIGLALFLTFFTMWPVWNKVNTTAVQPYMRHEMSFDQAADAGVKPVRDFMFAQVREKDLGLFISLAHMKQPKNEADVPTHVLIPAFLISELRTAFSIGFLIFIPFLVIDMLISVTLMSMGMMMLPPVLISLPFKILLFVLVDGWHLIIQSLTMSFN